MNVEWVPLRDVLRLDQHPIQVAMNGRYPSAGVLNRGRGLFDKGVLSGADTSYGRLFRLAAGHIVYSKLFGWEGAIALVPREFEGHFVSSEFPTFAPDVDRVVPGFLEQYLKSAEFTEKMTRSTNGLGQRRQRVNVDAFLRITVPMPPLSDQERIVEHLGQLPQPARSFRSPDELISGPVARAVADARRVSFGSLLDLKRSPIELVDGETYRRIGIYSWGKGMLRRDPAPVAEMGSMHYFKFPVPSLVFSNIQAWEGAVALAGPEDAGHVCSSRFYPYVRRPGADVDLRYLLEFFRSDEGVDLLRGSSPGTQVRNKLLSRSALESAVLPVPSMSIQERIVRRRDSVDHVHTVTKRADELVAALLPAARNEIFNLMR